MDQHYCLRWNKHQTNLTDVLASQRELEKFCDVTLSVGAANKTLKVTNDRKLSSNLLDDEITKAFNDATNQFLVIKYLQAHKAILSACSPYFENIFIGNNCSHPIMHFIDVDYEVLEAIIDYIYKGEVNIAQYLLQKFLKTAEQLQVSAKLIKL